MSSDNIDPHIWLIIIICLLIVHALISAAKSALDTTDRNKVKEMLEDEPENNSLQTVMKMLNHQNGYHYADLIVTYIIYFACFFILNTILLSGFGLRARIVYNFILFVVFVSFTDILPKKLASQSSESYGTGLSIFQLFFCYLMVPFVKLCEMFANIILLILRKDTRIDDSHFSEDKVMSMLDKGQESGEIKEEGRRMIDSIFEFDDLLAYEIMTPRTDVFMIDIEDDKEEYLEELMELTHSRIPVCEGDQDNIIGVLHIKDYLLEAVNSDFDSVNIRELLRDPYFVPETKNIDSLFIELQRTKNHLAILIDEYGGFSGIVTIEDIIEQIVGDIDDEFDEDDKIIEQTAEDTFIVDGNVYLDDLLEETDIELESDNSETVGGFIIDLMGEIPKEDTYYPPIEYENYQFTILSVRDRRIEKLRIVVNEASADDADSDEER